MVELRIDRVNTPAIDFLFVHEGAVEGADLATQIGGHQRHIPSRVIQNEMQMRIDPVGHVRPARRHRLIGRDHRAREISTVRILKEVISRFGCGIERGEIEPERRIVRRCRRRDSATHQQGRDDAQTETPQPRHSHSPASQNATPNPMK
jgi:hypothetical protein